jgi:hypothetical protein
MWKSARVVSPQMVELISDEKCPDALYAGQAMRNHTTDIYFFHLA